MRPEASPPPAEDRNRRVAEALAPRYEAINRLWAEAEARLVAMQMPRYAWAEYDRVDLEPYAPYSIEHIDCIGLVRYQGEWRLCYGSYVSDGSDGSDFAANEPTNWRPITDCPVEIRVGAAPHIGLLRERIVASAEEFIARADVAIQQLTRSLEQL